MRMIMWYSTAVSAAVQTAALGVASAASQDPVDLAKSAVLFIALFTAVYRLGGLREQLNNASQNVSVELGRFREDLGRGLGGLDRRMNALDTFVSTYTEHRLGQERFQERVDVRQEGFDRRLILVEDGRDVRRPSAA